MTIEGKQGTLYGVGIGPGDPELLTLKAVKVIQSCAVITYPEPRGSSGRVLAADIATAALPELASKRRLGLHLPMTRDAEVLAANRQAAASAICEHLAAGEDVCFLTLGDPSIYSTYIYLHRIVRQRGYRVVVVPGVTSFCAAAAILGDGLVDAEQPLHIVPASYPGVGWGVSGDGMDKAEASGEIDGGVSVLMKSGLAILDMLDKLQAVERSGGSVGIVENCGLPNQRIWQVSEITAENKPGYFTVVVVKAAAPAVTADDDKEER